MFLGGRRIRVPPPSPPVGRSVVLYCRYISCQIITRTALAAPVGVFGAGSTRPPARWPGLILPCPWKRPTRQPEPDLMHSRTPHPNPYPASSPPRPAGRAPFFLCRDQYLPRCHGNGPPLLPRSCITFGAFYAKRSARSGRLDGCRKEPEDGSFEGRRHRMKLKGHDTLACFAFVSVSERKMLPRSQ